jgi:hypothetical protein
MRLIEAAPDETMMFAGYEQHTFECSGCHLHARRIVSTHEIGPFPEERMRLPSGWLMTKNWSEAKVAWARAVANLPVGPRNPSSPRVAEPSQCISSGYSLRLR